MCGLLSEGVIKDIPKRHNLNIDPSILIDYYHNGYYDNALDILVRFYNKKKCKENCAYKIKGLVLPLILKGNVSVPIQIVMQWYSIDYERYDITCRWGKKHEDIRELFFYDCEKLFYKKHKGFKNFFSQFILYPNEKIYSKEDMEIYGYSAEDVKFHNYVDFIEGFYPYEHYEHIYLKNIQNNLKSHPRFQKEINLYLEGFKYSILNYSKDTRIIAEFFIAWELTQVYDAIIEQYIESGLIDDMSGIKWVSEYQLYKEVKNRFIDEVVIHQGSPAFLKRQKFDIWLPERKIAIEYNGIQHYEEVSLFGGKEGLNNSIKRDKRKKKKCVENNIELIIIDESDNLEKALINIEFAIERNKNKNALKKRKEKIAKEYNVPLEYLKDKGEGALNLFEKRNKKNRSKEF